MAEKTNEPAGYTDNIQICAEEIYKDSNNKLERRQGWRIPEKERINEIINGMDCNVIQLEDSRDREKSE